MNVIPWQASPKLQATDVQLLRSILGTSCDAIMHSAGRTPVKTIQVDAFYHLSVGRRVSFLIAKHRFEIRRDLSPTTVPGRFARLRWQLRQAIGWQHHEQVPKGGTCFRPLMLPTPSSAGGRIALAQRVQSSSHIASHVFTVSITTAHKTEIEYVTN